MTDDIYVKSEASVGEVMNASFAASIALRDDDGIVAEGRDWVELVANVRAALTEARAQGAADERERLAKAVEGDATPITVPVEVEPRTWQPITIDHRALSAWLRSQKDTTHDQ